MKVLILNVYFNWWRYYLYIISSQDTFVTILKEKIYGKDKYFLVEYDTHPTLRWIIEQEIPSLLLDEFYKHERSRSDEKICKVYKEHPCLNKHKTKGELITKYFSKKKIFDIFGW